MDKSQLTDLFFETVALTKDSSIPIHVCYDISQAAQVLKVFLPRIQKISPFAAEQFLKMTKPEILNNEENRYFVIMRDNRSNQGSINIFNCENTYNRNEYCETFACGNLFVKLYWEVSELDSNNERSCEVSVKIVENNGEENESSNWYSVDGRLFKHVGKSLDVKDETPTRAIHEYLIDRSLMLHENVLSKCFK